MHHQTAGRRRASRLACVIGKHNHADLVGAHLCVRPCMQAACCSGPTHRSAPPGVAKAFYILVGLRMSVTCSGRGKPRPYKGTRQVCHLRRERACPFRRTQKRSVTWRSDLLINLTYVNTFMPTPGPGPQARCGKGEGSGEGLGDRCRVPRSSPPSGAGREQRQLLQSTQRDDHPTKGEHAAAAATPHPALRATFPSRGRQRVPPSLPPKNPL